MRGVRRTTGLVLCVLLGMVWTADAAISLPTLIGDHMVLQRGENLKVWGKAEPGEKISVAICNRKGKTKVGKDGKWMVKLRKLEAGGPYEMTIGGDDETIVVKDVLVGDVWVCSGQSNMQFAVSNSNNAEQEIAQANHPKLRLFSVPRVVAGEPRDRCGGEWTACTPETIPGFSAVGYFFGREIQTQLGVPVGLIHTSWGGTPAESWTTRKKLLKDPITEPIVERWDKIVEEYPQKKADYDKRLAAWQEAADKAKADGKEPAPKPGAPLGPGHPHRASGLYNAMISPLIDYAVCGAIWYQGESNASRAYQYRTLFPAMIQDWRNQWGIGKFPFYFVQLANWQALQTEPGDDAWAELREAQLMTLDLRNTGMAVIIDIGDAGDIHPRNKQDVGKRLALAALATEYGKDIAYSGPIYKSDWYSKGEIRLKFRHTDGGLVARGGQLEGFAVAGPDRRFVWADARIEGDKIVVSSDQVPMPVAVRYGWAINPKGNLYNGAGLPASPFRTDDWPGMTVKAR